MSNIFDRFGNWINESCFYDSGSSYSSAQQTALMKTLQGFHAVDTPIGGGMYGNGSANGSTENQLREQAAFTIIKRNELFDRIDLIKYHPLATTIKDIIISDGFNDLCGGYAMTIQYNSPKKEEKEELTKEIDNFIKRTKIIDILKDCVTNEGIDYCELFLSTPCEYGRGVIRVSDNLELREYIAIYKNTELVGALKFEFSGKNNSKVHKVEFVKANEISHFMLNYKKLPIRITKDFNKKYDIPEKLRCAFPILAPVVDLIIQYNILEKIRTALEIMKATQPITMGIAVSPDQDMGEISRQLQELSIALNKNKSNVINSLDSLDISTLLNSMQTIELIPYTPEQGYNSLRQVNINYQDSNLNDKINDLRKSIAQAVGVPEQYLASSNYVGAKDTKEDSLLSNPRYSAMLSKIQQLLAKGLIDVIYKHLRYKYSQEDGTPTRKIDRELIEVQFNSATNLNDRLEDENLLLNANCTNEMLSLIEAIASSVNIPVEVVGENFMKFWKQQMYKDPNIRDIFKLLTKEQAEKRRMEQMGMDPNLLANPEMAKDKVDVQGLDAPKEMDSIRNNNETDSNSSVDIRDALQ